MQLAQQPSILVVDDERQILTALSDLLEDHYRVFTANSAREAMSIIDGEPGLQVVMSDQRMPEIQGVDLLTQARDHTNATRVLLTGYADLQAVVRAVNDGKIFAYVSKPWAPDELRMVVFNAAEFYRLGRRLREEQGLLQTLMQQAPDGLYFKDLQHRYVQLNAAHARLLRAQSPDAVIGRTDDEFWPVDVAAQHRSAEQQMLRDGRPLLDRTDRMEGSDGEPRWYSTSKAPISDDTRKFHRIVGITRDITERVETEAQNRLLGAVAQAVARAPDFEQALRSAIMLVCQETGWAYGEAWVFNETRTALVAGPQWYARDDRFASFRAGRTSLRFAKGEGIAGRVWQDGVPLWVTDIHADPRFVMQTETKAAGLHACLVMPIKDTNDTVVAVLTFFLETARKRDERLVAVVSAVSDQLSNAFERKLATDALARERSFLKALIDSIQDGILVFDETGKVVFRNKTADHFMPPTVEGVAGRSWNLTHRIVSIDGKPFAPDQTPVRRALNGQGFQAVQVIAENPDKSLSYISASGGPVSGDSGRTSGAVIVLRDVTGQQETEHRLRYAQKMEALGDMTAGICHDFNNVIQAICGSLDLLIEQVEDEELAKLANAALSAAGRSVDLMRKLVSFARSSELKPVEIDMNRHVEGLVDVLRSSVGRSINVQTQLDPAIGMVHLDPSELDAAIINLAVNARDAMPRGGRLRIATYEADAETVRGAGLDGGQFIALEVADTGDGIPEAIRERIFEPYFTTKAEDKGTGLGLAMIYGFVSQSGGQILVHSKEGEGTAFTLLFPRFELG